MKLTAINAGYFKLDGGAMFGVVPKVMWDKLNPADKNNQCTWALRCLLVETEDRKVLIDTGMGDKQSEKFRSHFKPHGEDSLIGNLAKNNIAPEDITDVIITHLHFDHVGGAVRYDAAGALVPTFPNAVYWTNKSHYDWASTPNPRERASFLKENFVPLKEAGVLRFVEEKQDVEIIPGIHILFMYGHTEAMMLPKIKTEQMTIIYGADLIPSSFHYGLPYVMGYDLRPLQVMKEKELVLKNAFENGYYFFFEHDPMTEVANVVKDKRGRYAVGTRKSLKELGLT